MQKCNVLTAFATSRQVEQFCINGCNSLVPVSELISKIGIVVHTSQCVVLSEKMQAKTEHSTSHVLNEE